jgi:hypothetical protein
VERVVFPHIESIGANRNSQESKGKTRGKKPPSSAAFRQAGELSLLVEFLAVKESRKLFSRRWAQYCRQQHAKGEQLSHVC